ncbi:MAG: type II toxin-antitoxin system RelE/ParE family toxin [Planctomycetota bacterium]
MKGFPNHVIFYIEHSSAIDVVRILHGAQDLDAELKETQWS